MSSAQGAGTPPPAAKSLPPVETPNVRMILQLFIVPGLLVALVIGFILVFFGGVGTGPQSPAEFVAGLNNLSGHKRQQTAHDLAQHLPRKPELRADVPFALSIAEMLQREMNTPRDKDLKGNAGELMDLMEYLPAVAGNFVAPVSVPLLEQIVQQNADKLQDETSRLRFRNALVALGIQGSRVKEFDTASPQEQDRILSELNKASSDKPGPPTWAKLAQDYLAARRQHVRAGDKKPLPDTLGIVNTLALGARSNDELSRKLTILALAHWREAGTEELLRQMTNPGDGIDIWEDGNHERGLREIRYNAALALARRGSALTPDDLVLECLDEATLKKVYPDAATSPALHLQTKALRDLQEFKKAEPAAFEQKAEIKAAVEKLASSEAVAVRMEAARLLEGQVPPAAAPPSFSQQVLLMAGLGGSILFFMAIAVVARWRKKPEPAAATV